jgi:hypothetical protein
VGKGDFTMRLLHLHLAKCWHFTILLCLHLASEVAIAVMIDDRPPSPLFLILNLRLSFSGTKKQTRNQTQTNNTPGARLVLKHRLMCLIPTQKQRKLPNQEPKTGAL